LEVSLPEDMMNLIEKIKKSWWLKVYTRSSTLLI
jgi:hypothetical protein